MKVEWKRKLTSRKFWSAIVGFITPLLIAFNVSSDTATQVTSIIMSGGALIAYIIGEGLADSNNSHNITEDTECVTDYLSEDDEMTENQ